jgi:diacylglycerol kinase family enzyme
MQDMHSQTTSLAPAYGSSFASRAAFLLNKNARAVTQARVDRIAGMVPAGDLFLSRSFEDAEAFARTILQRGYGEVFLGGGDGTLVGSMNVLRRVAAQMNKPMPRVGVLRLGTGNAMAQSLGAMDPLLDIHHVVQRGSSSERDVHFVETSDGTLTPFAGMGYDGAILNDYIALKNSLRGNALAHKFASGLGGYLAATLLKSVPTQLTAPKSTLRITTSKPATFMRPGPGGDEAVGMPAGSVLFEGPATTVSVGAIPYYGFRFHMFPFAGKQPGTMQLRVLGAPIPNILANLWPGVWHGTWRHPQLLDFLVEDVVIESTHALPYQLGGDGAGHERKLHFRVAKEPVRMTVLGERLVPADHAVLQLGPAKLMVRLPR